MFVCVFVTGAIKKQDIPEWMQMLVQHVVDVGVFAWNRRPTQRFRLNYCFFVCVHVCVYVRVRAYMCVCGGLKIQMKIELNGNSFYCPG